MKTLLAILALCLPLCLSAIVITNLPPVYPVQLAFSYPTNRLGTNLWFNVYHTTNIADPLGTWGQITNFPGTGTVFAVSIVPGEHFFFVTASNFWGESIASNLTNTPPLPLNLTNVTLSK